MPHAHDKADRLAKCMRAAKGDPTRMAACEASFKSEGGTVVNITEGGKVFNDGDGGKVFVTNGGKVF